MTDDNIEQALAEAPEYDLLYDYDEDYCPCMQFHNEGFCVCGDQQ